MKILNLKQGSEEWKAERAKKRNASEAPAVMGVSKKTSRNELIQMKATGTEKEFSDWVQKNLLDNGHAIEKATHPIAEKIVGEELFPASAEDDDGYLAASYDGLTMMGDVCWENKSWNEEKAAIVRQGEVPEEDVWQVIQQLAIGPEKCLYTVSDGTEDKTVYVWVTLDEADRQKLLAGWKQFDEDVANYQHVEAKPEAVAEPVTDLPSVSVHVSGAIDIIDNFQVFENALRDFIDNQLIKEPKTDQDFANLDSQIKALKRAEEALDAAESYALAQVEVMDRMKRTKDTLRELARSNRLRAEKLLEAEKKNRRNEILQNAKQALADHVEAINETLEGVTLPPVTTDFAAAMKGKRTITTLQNAADTELANAKIAANETADQICANLKALDELAADHRFLFNDLQAIVTKPADDFKAIIKARIAEHKEAEEKRLEAERERIRQEEQAKAEAEAARKAQEEQARIAEQHKAEEARADVISQEDANTAADAIEEVLEQDLAAPQNAVDDLPDEARYIDGPLADDSYMDYTVTVAVTADKADGLEAVRAHINTALSKAGVFARVTEIKANNKQAA